MDMSTATNAVFRPLSRRGSVQDPNTKTALFESDEIIKYLNATYGGPPPPKTPEPKTAEATTTTV
jgi:glutathione S-transferase